MKKMILAFLLSIVVLLPSELLLADEITNTIYKYEYSDSVPKDEVISENMVNGNLEITISLGKNEDAEIIFEQNNVSSTQSESFSLFDSNISIDGSFDDWSSLPMSYEYNWDNSENCWYWGEWKDDVCYKTEEGTYDTNVRHGMQLYCDGEYVYLHIIIATIYDAEFNGDDYRFYIDDQEASFSLESQDGNILQNGLGLETGLHPVVIRHRDSANSYVTTVETDGYINVNENRRNAELELRLPLSAMKEQNPNINIENIGVVEYFNPNLMYRRVSCAGTNSGPVIFAAISVIMASTAFFACKSKKKTKSEEKTD